MIYTDNLDHKPAAVELERLPDGTAWLRLYKDIKEVSEETTHDGESYTSKHWEATCAACGKEAKVPFEPKSDRPVYFSDCFAKIKEQQQQQ